MFIRIRALPRVPPVTSLNIRVPFIRVSKMT